MIPHRPWPLRMIAMIRPRRQFLRALLLWLTLIPMAACLQADPLVMPIQPWSPLTEAQIEMFRSPLTGGLPVASMEPPTSAESNPAVDFYTQAFGVSVEEAERRLRLQYPMGLLGAEICEAEATCAGSWMQHEPVFGLVVAFTLPVEKGEAIVDKYLKGVKWADQVMVVQRTYTLAELEEMLRLAGEILQGVEGLDDLIYASGLDIPMGKVRLYTPDPIALHAKLVHERVFEGTGIWIGDIEFVYQAQPMVPASPLASP